MPPATASACPHVVVRQSEDWTSVLVAPHPAASDAAWSPLFTRGADGTVRDGAPGALVLVRDAHTLELEGRLEPPNASHLSSLAPSVSTVRVNNDSRGPRSSLGAQTLVISWNMLSSYILPDLDVSPRTRRLVMDITDGGGPISPANRRFLPDVPLDVDEAVFAFSRWSHAVLDPFCSRRLYPAVANLLLRGARVTLVDFGRVFACMTDASPELWRPPPRHTALPARADAALRAHILEALRANPTRLDPRALEGQIRDMLARLTLENTPHAEIHAHADEEPHAGHETATPKARL